MPFIRLSCAASETLDVRKFRISEAVDQNFQIDIEAIHENASLDLATIVGRGATLSVDTGYAYVTQGTRTWSGVVSSVELVRGVGEDSASGSASRGGLRSTYSIRIVPTLWLLTQKTNYRIFQRLSIPDIVKKVLSDWGIEADWQIGDYPKLEFRTQYGETDFDFISRLLEEAGISFVHVDRGGTTGLVMSDQLTSSPVRSHGELRYADSPMEAAQQEFATRLHLNHSVRPGASVLADYDFRNPGFRMVAEAPPAEARDLEIYAYRPASFLREAQSGGTTPTADDKGAYRRLPGHGQTSAKVSLESARTGNQSVAFQTNVIGLGPGAALKVTNHPHVTLQEELLVRKMKVQGGTHADHLDIDLECTLTRSPFRPAQKTPKPRIAGPQSAMVVGPAGDEIHVDEYGRIRVQFPWDREGEANDESSVWMRVVQGWGGTGYGMITIPRVGQEVLVSFLDGDPDAPIIVGRVYNELNPVPYPLPDNKTVSGWRTNSSPTNGGYNEIKLEDRATKELLYVQAQKDLHRLVKRDVTEKFGRHHHLTVEENQHVVVKKSKRERVLENDHLVVGGSRYQEIKGSTSLTVGENCITEAGKQVRIASGDLVVLEAGSRLSIKGPGGFITIHDGGVDIVGNIVNINSGGSAADGDDAEKPKEAEEAYPKDDSRDIED
jgi:type VI secretion system secreted protein VgrG